MLRAVLCSEELLKNECQFAMCSCWTYITSYVSGLEVAGQTKWWSS